MVLAEAAKDTKSTASKKPYGVPPMEKSYTQQSMRTVDMIRSEKLKPPKIQNTTTASSRPLGIKMLHNLPKDAPRAKNDPLQQHTQIKDFSQLSAKIVAHAKHYERPKVGPDSINRDSLSMMKTSPSNGTIMTQSQTPISSKQSTCFDEAI